MAPACPAEREVRGCPPPPPPPPASQSIAVTYQLVLEWLPLSGHPAWRQVLLGQCYNCLARCQYTVIELDSKSDQRLLSQAHADVDRFMRYTYRVAVTSSNKQCCWLVGRLTSHKHASVRQGRISSDKSTCCHNETEVTDQAFCLTRSQHTDTGRTSPSVDLDLITPGAWWDSH